MPNKVPPAGSQPPAPSNDPSKTDQTKKPAQPQEGATGKQTMDDLLSQCTPEQKKKFFDILNQNIARQIEKDNKKMIEEIKKERENIQKGE